MCIRDSSCTEYLLDKGYAVTVFDSLVTGHRDAVDKRAEFVKGDLSDRELIINVLKKGGFDGIMHFAAYSLVGESMTNPGKYFQNSTFSAAYTSGQSRYHQKISPVMFFRRDASN